MAWLSTNKLATHPTIIERAASGLPQSTQSPLFVVSGRVILVALVGEVTSAIQNQANDTKLIANPTVGADVDLCAVLDIDNHTVGTIYLLTGTFSDALSSATSGAIEMSNGTVVLANGTVDLDCNASNSGAIKWVLHYVPLDIGGYVTAA